MAVKIDLEGRTISLGVGDLVADPFAQIGRVAGLSLWTRMALGREAHQHHQRDQSWRHRGYVREITVRHHTRVDDFDVLIQGRIDGVYLTSESDAGARRWVVEEVKSVVLPSAALAGLHLQSYPHYTEQLRLYCYLVSQTGPTAAPETGVDRPRRKKGRSKAASRELPPRPAPEALEGRLVFVNLADGSRRELPIEPPFDDCAERIAERVRVLLARAQEEEQGHVERRGRAGQLQFPHARPRKHQDELMESVERALAAGRHLMVSAPSGIGKTAGVLYPVMKHAFAHDQRVFFVTAKNTQQEIVMETLRRMGLATWSGGVAASASGRTRPATRWRSRLQDPSPVLQRDVVREPAVPFPVRETSVETGPETPTAVQFRAREQLCINQVYACREEFCPHLQMFALKLQRTGVLERLLAQRLVTPDNLIDAGRGTSLCPFELALLAAEQTDLVLGDYNYVFDPQVYFRRFFQDADYSDSILVIDEAHNLLARAMDYYSPVLRRQQIKDLSTQLEHLDPSLARDLRKFLHKIEDYFRAQARPAYDEYSQLGPEEMAGGKQFQIDSPREFFDSLKPAFHKLAMRYLLDKMTNGRVVPDDPVEQFFADFGQFCSVLGLEGEEFAYVFDATDSQSLKIVCLDPSPQLAGRLGGFHSVIAMSATLQPAEFYREMLGFDPDRTDVVSFPSPFPRENRRILIAPDVLTTYRQRAGHYGRVAEILRTTVSAHSGNYLALFPSYQFLRAVAGHLVPDLARQFDRRQRPEIRDDEPDLFHQPGLNRTPLELADHDYELIIQEPRMTESERKALLESLRETEVPKLVLAVQGGLFAEGVDYPGDLVSGVIVISPALPQVGFERELMRRYYQERHGKGFEYAYLYPGMNRVIQSVGRLIRSETDRGVAVLVCQRFTYQQYAALFPSDWSENGVKDLVCRDLAGDLAEFWRRFLGSRARGNDLYNS